jgi:hypothetical protein
MSDELTGVWTYRSFRNRPADADSLDQLLAGQGELVIEHPAAPGALFGRLVFRGETPTAKDPRLTLVGGVSGGHARFQGIGVKGTQADGWVYDYEARLVPSWPNGVHQRPALVGSVIRTVPHAAGGGQSAPAGTVFSFIACKRDFLEPRLVIPLPDATRAMLAGAGHRLWHLIWHTVRGGWLRGLRMAQKRDIHRLGWAPGAPSDVADARAAVDAYGPILTNGSGEDFLFMHRQMIKMVADSAGAAAPKPWPGIPAPGPIVIDPDPGDPRPQFPPAGNPNGFAVPPAWHDPDNPVDNHRLPALKSDSYYYARMNSWDREFKNPAFLAGLSLGALGALLEFTVHNAMHMRWSAIPHDPVTGEPLPGGRPDDELDGKWLLPDYDYLREFFSSHVNPVFWRLHGWVDDRINDWFAAHQTAHPGAVREIAHGGVKWFATGDWVKCADPWSGPPGQIHHGHPHFDERVMREVLKVVARPASEDPPPPPDALAEPAAVAPYPAFPRVSPLHAFSRPFFPAD